MQSDSRLPPTNSKLQLPRKSLSIDERKSLEQQKSLPLILNKQKSLPQNLRTTVKLKEKSASDHMAIAAKKLKHQQSKPTSSGIINPMKLKAKDNLKSLPKIPKVCERVFYAILQTISFLFSQKIQIAEQLNRHRKFHM